MNIVFLLVQPRSLAPFFLDSYTYPSNQEACCLEVNSLICKGLLSGNDNALHNVSVEFDASLDVMNYKDLSWRNCLSVSSVIAEMSLNTVSLICCSLHYFRKALQVNGSGRLAHRSIFDENGAHWKSLSTFGVN